MALSIVMPTFNEKEIVEKVVREYCVRIISKIPDSEFIIIDSSNDGTYEVLEKLRNECPGIKLMRTPYRSGHGRAILAGYRAASGEYVFQTDSDDQFDPEDFWKLYALREGNDFVLGVRENRHDPLHRLILTRVIRFVNCLIFGIWIRDANCPFRLMRRDVMSKFLGLIQGDMIAPNIALSIAAFSEGIRIAEVPVNHAERKTGEVSIVKWKLIKAAWTGFRQLIAFRFVGTR